MAYIIAEPCIGTKDASCVAVCPVDCIYEGDDQYYINPDECIDCGACEPECPWEAIFTEDDVPAALDDDVALNAITAARPTEFAEGTIRKRPRPSEDEVRENRRRWLSAPDLNPR